MALNFRRKNYQNPDSRFISKIDRRIVANFDWVLLVMVALLVVIGLVNLFSTTNLDQTDSRYDRMKLNFASQFRWSIIGVLFLIVAFIINYRLHEGTAYWIYSAFLILLVAVLFFGPTIHGAKRWLVMAGLRFQPSELAKLGLVLALAKYLSTNKVPKGYNFREIIIPGGIILVPTLLILKQPDLGTGMLFILIGGTMLIFSGIRWHTIIGLLATFGAIAPMAWKFLLKGYQKERILIWFNPEMDPSDKGYHILQSLNAIGSGKLFGKGFLNSTQDKLGFLPEPHTDFVFAVFAEVWGFFGCIVLLALYFTIIVWSMSVALYSKDRFAAFLAVGLASIIFWHTFINIAMVIGVAPVVGMPLPFMSYGRSSLITMMIVVGLLLNVSSRRYVF